VRETVSDTIDGKITLPGSQDAVQQAIQGIILNEESLILRVHEDTYMFPRSYDRLNPHQLQLYGDQHRQVKDAILNDGMSPEQLKVLRENLALYIQAERKRHDLLREQEQWCDWLLPPE